MSQSEVEDILFWLSLIFNGRHSLPGRPDKEKRLGSAPGAQVEEWNDLSNPFGVEQHQSA
jgi:hypothetical protein